MNACKIIPLNRREIGTKVGDKLLKKHGKKRFYSRDQVKNALLDSGFPLDVDCWAYSLYTSRQDFDAYHQSIGEVCDYAAMRTEMVTALTESSPGSWFDVDLSWLEWPDIDLSGIFDFFDVS